MKVFRSPQTRRFQTSLISGLLSSQTGNMKMFRTSHGTEEIIKQTNLVLCSFQTDLALCINYKFEFCPKCSRKHALQANNVQILRTAFKDASD